MVYFINVHNVLTTENTVNKIQNKYRRAFVGYDLEMINAKKMEPLQRLLTP